MICPNLNDPLVKQEFDALVAEIGEDAAYNAWYLHDGNVPKIEQTVPQKITSNDKIIWGHPGVGKTFLRESNPNVIDFDSDYKSRINEKYNLPEGFKARNEWRESNPELWKEEIRQLWSEAKQESQDTGKQLLASDMMLLREFPNDFDKVVNISNETFIDRAKQRDDYTEGETEQWKVNINEVLGNIDQSKIIQTDKYMSELLPKTNNIKVLEQELVDGFLKDFNITVTEYENLKKDIGLDSYAAADLITKSIAYQKGESILPEVAYFAYSMLGKQNSKVRSELKYLISKWDKYKERYDFHTENVKKTEGYIPDVNEWKNKIKDLVILDFLRENLENHYNNPQEFAKVLDKRWTAEDFTLWEMILRWLDKLLRNFNTNNQEKIDKLKDIGLSIADEVINRNYQYFDYKLKDSQIQKYYKDTIESDLFAKDLVDFGQSLGMVLTGSLALRRAGTVYRTVDETIHDIDWVIPYDLNSSSPEDMQILSSILSNQYYMIRNAEIEDLDINYVAKNTATLVRRFEWFQKFEEKYPNFAVTNAFYGKEHTKRESITIQGAIDGEFYEEDGYHQEEVSFYRKDPYTKEPIKFTEIQTKKHKKGEYIKGTGYAIDFFVRLQPKQEEHENYFLLQKEIMMAKIKMGRDKDFIDWKVFVPFIKSKDSFNFNYQGFRHLNYVSEGNALEDITEDIPSFKPIRENNQEEDEEFIPSFKPKPSNTLSLLKQEEFKNSLTVGEKAQPFLYWSETTSKQVAEKGVIVDRVLNDRFEGRYVDTGEERTFKFANVIDESLERGMTRNQQKFYKNNLVLGETIDVETQQETYRGEVVEIGEEEVQIQDANGAIIAIPYNIIFKPNAQMKLAKVVQKLKQTFSTQLAIYRRSPKSAEQQKRIESYEKILKTLEDYNQIEDFTVFLEETNKALFRAKTILDRVVSPDNVESNEKKLYVISYVKDLLNSFKNIKDLSTIIEDFDGSDILKGYMEDFNNRLAIAETTFKNVAIPQLGSLLWDYYDPKLNDKMIAVGLDPYTKERLIDELSDPSRDIDFFNQVFVAPSNVNDVIMGLFVKMIKGGKEQARLQDAKFLTNIVPLVEKVKEKYGLDKFKEILKTFYKIVPVTEERDGQKVIINTREFIKEHDFSPYFNTIKEFKKLINAAEAKKVLAENALAIEYSDEMNQQRLTAEGDIIALKKQRAIFYNNFGIPVSPEKLKKTMDNNYMWDPEIFYDDLSNYYSQVTDPDSIAELDPETSISIQNEATGELEHYIRNERPRSEPNPDKYITPEWAQLTAPGADEDIKALLVGLIDEYNSANRKLPYTRRIKDNKVPCLKKQDTLKNLKSIWDKITQAISEGNFFSKAYAKIRNEVKDFLKTGSPQYRRRMDGKPYREIPIGVTTVMDVEDSSDDIIMSTLMFVREANNFSYMNNFVGSSEVIIDVLTIQDPLDEEQPEGVEVEINRRKEALLSFFKQQIYGEFNTTHGPLSKTIDFLGKATALTTIGLNPKSWLGNFFIGNWVNLSEGFGGRFYNMSDILWADKQFMKMLWNEKDRKKLMNMINSLDAIQGRFSKTFGEELMSFKEKYGRLDNLFIGQDLAEIQIQGSAMLAMLKSQGIEIPEDGIFTEENTANLQDFKNLLHAVNKRNHGVYNDFDRLHFQTNAVFRLFLQFRKWVVSTFRARYAGVMSGEYRIDIEMGSVEKGWYRLTYEYFRDSLANGMSLVEALKNANDPNLTDVQREGLRRSLIDFLGFVIGSMLILAMTWGDDDDEEDFVGEFFIIYYLMRLVSEIGVYLPFLGFSDKLRMVANPFGAAGTLKDIIGLFGLVMDFEVDKDGNVSIFKEYQRDTGRYEEGELKLWGKMAELNVASNFLEITDPKQLIENFEAASRM